MVCLVTTSVQCKIGHRGIPSVPQNDVMDLNNVMSLCILLLD